MVYDAQLQEALTLNEVYARVARQRRKVIGEQVRSIVGKGVYLFCYIAVLLFVKVASFLLR